MMSRGKHQQPELSGSHGQFGDETVINVFIPMRATQRVMVKPVVPRRSPQRAVRAKPTKDLLHKQI